MDSPDRMSWSPSSSAKKRKLAEFEYIQTSPQLYIPGAYPPSLTISINVNSDYYQSLIHHAQSSPTPHLRIIPGPVPAHPDGLMHNYLQAPQFWGPLVQMINQAGNTVTATLSNTLGIFAGPGARFAHCLRNNAGPLYAAIQAVGSTAKRVKLTLRPNRTEVPPQHTTSPEQPSTPTQRTSRNMKRSPSPTLRSQTSILHHARETGLRKSRATVHWVEEQKLFEQLIHERETVDLAVVDCVQNDMQPMDGLQFVPTMSGALPIDNSQAQGDTDMLADESVFGSQDSYESELMIQSDDQESTSSSVSSDITDSVTSSMLAGLTEEDLKHIETKQEKKQR
ncbi:MAG: hypothetical protein Q9228_007896, partial [Teloschistes exilis]